MPRFILVFVRKDLSDTNSNVYALVNSRYCIDRHSMISIPSHPSVHEDEVTEHIHETYGRHAYLFEDDTGRLGWMIHRKFHPFSEQESADIRKILTHL